MNHTLEMPLPGQGGTHQSRRQNTGQPFLSQQQEHFAMSAPFTAPSHTLEAQAMQTQQTPHQHCSSAVPGHNSVTYLTRTAEAAQRVYRTEKDIYAFQNQIPPSQPSMEAQSAMYHQFEAIKQVENARRSRQIEVMRQAECARRTALVKQHEQIRLERLRRHQEEQLERERNQLRIYNFYNLKRQEADQWRSEEQALDPEEWAGEPYVSERDMGEKRELARHLWSAENAERVYYLTTCRR